MATKFFPFYNVGQPVGKTGTNNSEDVVLVQFFLSEVAKVPPHPIPPPATPLTVNGMASPALTEWILWFQNCVKKVGKPVQVDGRIDPAMLHGGDIYGGSGTIVHLNVTYRRRFRAGHNALETASNCPASLRMKFTGQDW